MAKKESTRGENLAKQIIEQYNPKSVQATHYFASRTIFFSLAGFSITAIKR